MIVRDYPADCGQCHSRQLCPICNPPRTEEQMLRQQLVELRRRYMDEAQPIIDRLVAIEARKPPKPVFIPIDMIDPGVLRRLRAGVVVSGDIGKK